jgi:hypothetical protein
MRADTGYGTSWVKKKVKKQIQLKGKRDPDIVKNYQSIAISGAKRSFLLFM